jgi:hypothetical protein
MRKKQLIIISGSVALLALVVAASAPAKLETFQVGNLILKDDGGVTPEKMPRHRQVPISAHLFALIETADGAHPPAFRNLVADFDRTFVVDAEGLPVCKLGQLQARSTEDAKRACPDAIVGSGEAEVEVAFPEQAPFSAKGPLVAFNGGVQGGTTTLFIHAYVNVPAPTAVIVPVKITRVHRGHFGVHAVATVPAIAGGYGSPTRFNLDLGRRFTFRGHERSYLTGSCPTGTYFAEAQALFGDGTALHITHAFPCTPTD